VFTVANRTHNRTHSASPFPFPAYTPVEFHGAPFYLPSTCAAGVRVRVRAQRGAVADACAVN